MIQYTYIISAASDAVGPLKIQICANLCMNKINSQEEYYIYHFKCINIVRTELRTKIILARPQSVGESTTQLVRGKGTLCPSLKSFCLRVRLNDELTVSSCTNSQLKSCPLICTCGNLDLPYLI